MNRILIIGGDADGHRITLDSKERAYLHVHKDRISRYVVHTLMGAFGELFYIGAQNLNDCPMLALLAGYRKPREHHTDLNVAAQLVTLLGGKADGRQIALSDSRTFVPAGEMGDAYQIVCVDGKDDRKYRVGVLDAIAVDPIKILYEGYRYG